MPHIVIKTIGYPSKEALEEAAEEIKQILIQKLGKREKTISIALEECTYEDWPQIYEKEIKGNDNLLVKPGYTDPVTFD
ncbi:MAG: tautomerase family protein [Eubacteriaceae bacterium]|nr:tautomerase family protein [Eubacteriaceae bacterium]